MNRDETKVSFENVISFILNWVTGALAQLVARRSHNPKVVSSILTGPILANHNG